MTCYREYTIEETHMMYCCSDSSRAISISNIDINHGYKMMVLYERAL